jgi:hypothetical protein
MGHPSVEEEGQTCADHMGLRSGRRGEHLGEDWGRGNVRTSWGLERWSP